MYSCGLPHMDVQKQDDRHELTYSNYVRTQDVTLKTCRRRWMIGRSGERGSGISVLAAWHDDDHDIKPICLVRWSCRIHWLHLCRGMRLPNECRGYDPKQSDGEASVILELWRMWSTSSLPSLQVQFQCEKHFYFKQFSLA